LPLKLSQLTIKLLLHFLALKLELPLDVSTHLIKLLVEL
jgi:hypothetical protein